MDTPIVIKVDDIDTTFKIGFETVGNSYTLEVDETSFDDCQEWKEEVEVPEVGHSTYEEITAAHTQRFFFLVFLKGR